jgi:hypothetical protein
MRTVLQKKAKKLRESTKSTKGILYTIANEERQHFELANVFFFRFFIRIFDRIQVYKCVDTLYTIYYTNHIHMYENTKEAKGQ